VSAFGTSCAKGAKKERKETPPPFFVGKEDTNFLQKILFPLVKRGSVIISCRGEVFLGGFIF